MNTEGRWLAVWPDGTWIDRAEISTMSHMSDDYGLFLVPISWSDEKIGDCFADTSEDSEDLMTKEEKRTLLQKTADILGLKYTAEIYYVNGNPALVVACDGKDDLWSPLCYSKDLLSLIIDHNMLVNVEAELVSATKVYEDRGYVKDIFFSDIKDGEDKAEALALVVMQCLCASRGQ